MAIGNVQGKGKAGAGQEQGKGKRCCVAASPQRAPKARYLFSFVSFAYVLLFSFVSEKKYFVYLFAFVFLPSFVFFGFLCFYLFLLLS